MKFVTCQDVWLVSDSNLLIYDEHQINHVPFREKRSMTGSSLNDKPEWNFFENNVDPGDLIILIFWGRSTDCIIGARICDVN